MRLRQRGGHHHALAGGQAIGLDDDGRALLIDVGMGERRVGEGLVGSGRDLMPLHEGLGKGLRAFKLRRRLRRAEDAQATGTEVIDDAAGEWPFRADDRQRDLFALGEFGQVLEVGERQVVQPAVTGGAAIARCDIDRLNLGRLQELPGDRVFAATGADHENLHAGLRRAASRRPGDPSGGSEQPRAWGLIPTARRCETPPEHRPGLRSHRAASACVLHPRR